MEIRKFIVEIHPDGRVYASEYEDPGERLDIRDALQKIDLKCSTEVAGAWLKNEKYAVDALDRVEKLIARLLEIYWK